MVELPFRALFQGAPRYQAITPWHPLLALVLTLLAALGPQVAGALVVGALGAPATLASPIVLAISAAAQLASAAILWQLAEWHGFRPDVLQFRQPPLSWAACLGAGGLLIGVTSVLELAMYAGGEFDPLGESRMILEGLNAPYWPGIVIITVVLAPLWEELAFRGFLLTALAKTRLGIIGGGLVSNVLWTAMHMQYSASGLASVFLSGLFLTWLMWRTASIRACIVAHAIGNATALLFLAALSAA